MEKNKQFQTFRQQVSTIVKFLKRIGFFFRLLIFILSIHFGYDASVWEHFVSKPLNLHCALLFQSWHVMLFFNSRRSETSRHKRLGVLFMTVFLRCACCVFDYRTSVSTGKGVYMQRRYPARSRGHFFTSDAAIKFFYPVSCEAPRGLDASVL